MTVSTYPVSSVRVHLTFPFPFLSPLFPLYGPPSVIFFIIFSKDGRSSSSLSSSSSLMMMLLITVRVAPLRWSLSDTAVRLLLIAVVDELAIGTSSSSLSAVVSRENAGGTTYLRGVL